MQHYMLDCFFTNTDRITRARLTDKVINTVNATMAKCPACPKNRIWRGTPREENIEEWPREELIESHSSGDHGPHGARRLGALVGGLRNV